MSFDASDGLLHHADADHALEHVEPAVEGLGVPLGRLDAGTATGSDDLPVGGAGLELAREVLSTATACAHVTESAMQHEAQVIADQLGAALVDLGSDRLIQLLGDSDIVAAEHLEKYLVGGLSPLRDEGLDLRDWIGIVHPERRFGMKLGWWEGWG